MERSVETEPGNDKYRIGFAIGYRGALGNNVLGPITPTYDDEGHTNEVAIKVVTRFGVDGLDGFNDGVKAALKELEGDESSDIY